LLYDGLQKRNHRDLLVNAENTLKSLEVGQVKHVDIVRTFKGASKTEKTTCCSVNSNTILVTPGFDHFDVATIISKMFIRQPRLKDFLLISTLLSSSLENLSRKGFPVDRIINLATSKEKLPSNAVIKEAKVETKSHKIHEADNGEHDLEKLTAELITLFPEADPEFLATFAANVWPTTLEQAVDSLLSMEIPKMKDEPSSVVSLPPTKPGVLPDNPIDSFFESLSSISRQLGLGGASAPAPNPTPPKPAKITPQETSNLKQLLASTISQSRATTEANVTGNLGHIEPPVPASVVNSCSVMPDADLSLVGKVDSISLYIDRYMGNKLGGQHKRGKALSKSMLAPSEGSLVFCFSSRKSSSFLLKR
jgi:hypothetical protein